jgi:hypothetical protein
MRWVPTTAGNRDHNPALSRFIPANPGVGDHVVPDEGIEPPTFGLQNRCTTAVLIRRNPPLSPRQRRTQQPFSHAGAGDHQTMRAMVPP